MRMVIFMGCGGSRADAVDPRWQESWTGETESTWLTTTDTEPTQVASGSADHPRASAGKKGNTAACTGLDVSMCKGEDNRTSASKGCSSKERKL
ncbi:BAALC binder of MAP3K1 and KLF4 a [Electrophorus electricus]|uniref:BAALC binder of MAP3K1 and KLF4 a n=1 Tax=Electrophorus electricus TaxID=8005 RepID=UPI0015D0BE2A|nr:BAALC binder of MAP3K1 and KLF4 a [Electrophorus electricus]